MLKTSRIVVAGSGALVGSAIVRKLLAEGYVCILERPRAALDLRDPAAVDRFFQREYPEYLFIAAAKAGGILANSSSPVEFLSDNLRIQTNLLAAAHRFALLKVDVPGVVVSLSEVRVPADRRKCPDDGPSVS